MRLLCQHAKAFFTELFFLFGGLRPDRHGGGGHGGHGYSLSGVFAGGLDGLAFQRIRADDFGR